LKITTTIAGYTLQKVYGHPNNSTKWRKSVEQQPAVVVPTYRANLILYNSSNGANASTQYDINVTRDAWYYLGAGGAGRTWCRNIAFEPRNPAENKYLTDQIHFPSAADPNIHGFFLLENESQRGKAERTLHAERIELSNPYGDPIPFRKNESLATNVMFHIGGFYMARASALHARWLGGSEGCFAFIPKKSCRPTPEEAARITMDTAFFSNRTWVNLTTIIERYRDNDPGRRFFVEIEKRDLPVRDKIQPILMIGGASSAFINKIELGVESALNKP
jgi:hypothetical protein